MRTITRTPASRGQKQRVTRPLPWTRRGFAMLALDSQHPARDLFVGFLLGGAGVTLNVDFWQGAFFGLHPTGTTFSHPFLHATLNGPTPWTGDEYGGGIIGLSTGCGAAALLLTLAARRGNIRRRQMPTRTPL